MRHRELTLEELRDWYDECAQNYLYTRKERDLWKRLADELRQRVGPAPDPTRSSEPDESQTPLW
jgi:hypothetical protein